MNENMLTAQRVVQNNREFLISVVKVEVLKKYTKYTERIITGFDEKNLPIYNSQIQRKTNSAKVESIANYLLNDPDAMFPTNIVLAIPTFVIDEFIKDKEIVEITFSPIVEEELRKETGDVYISVIDGQHRLKGIEIALQKVEDVLMEYSKRIILGEKEIKQKEKYEKLHKSLLAFQMPITFFIDPTLEYQANIFSTINRTQTKVSESLVYSLFGLTDKVSPQRSALEITLSLNGFGNSPFFNRIKLVGNNYKRGESPPLTQAAMVKSILMCISPTIRIAEIERFYPRQELKQGINPDLCFRKYYANNDDLSITKILFAYYQSVKESFTNEVNESYWDLDGPDNILQTTVGYETLLNLLQGILADLERKKTSKEALFDIKTYNNYLNKVSNIDFTDFKTYPKQSATKTLLLEHLKSEIF